VSEQLSAAELEAVATVLRHHGEEVAGPLAAELISGGRSNLTIRLNDGVSGWVLRMPPRTGRTPSAHDVAREHRVISALGATDVPVPRAVALCEDESLLGGPFAVAELVAGTTVQSRDQLDRLDDAEVQAIAAALVDVLARLHRVDHVAVGLERLGRPDGYAERQLRRWSGQWQLVGDPDLGPLSAEVAHELGARLPRQAATAVVHGDYRIDNTLLLLDRTPPAVSAVVDWELCTIGDPVADVAMMCAYRDAAFDQVIGAPTAWTSPRLPAPDDLAAAYEAAGGVPLEDWAGHLALARYKIAVIAAGIAHRHVSAGGSGPSSAAGAVAPYLESAAATLR
jgi:aminoglycoside phosphotransferase (APT) family kinase protein